MTDKKDRTKMDILLELQKGFQKKWDEISEEDEPA